jgi:LysR family transcriptional regulator, low CO2-responsive transcriptional regulator
MDFPMLSLYKLEIFVAVVQAGSFSAAAQRFPMTQPAISQHIQDLENSLGTALFVRGRRGVTLTPAGETLFEYTQQIRRLVAEAESRVTNVENLPSGQLSIGATPGVSTYLLPEWLHAFREKYPQLNISLQTGVTTEHITGVMEHQIDLAFVEGELEKIHRKSLGHIFLRPVMMVVVVGQGHPWIERDSVKLAELTGQHVIMRQPHSRTRVWLDDVLEKHNVEPVIVAEFDNQEAIKQAVMGNMGLTILPDYAVQREVGVGLMKALTVEDVPLKRELKLLYDETMPLSPVARALLRYLLTFFPNLSKVAG